MKSFDTPLLLLAWRRPHTLRQVIDAIRPVAPTRIFVACDGPNAERPGEAEKVAVTRAVIEQEIDWPCEVQKLYSDTNQGCRLGVSRAITWFFEQVEEGIILEDDILPSTMFFYFAQDLLQAHKHDSHIMGISAWSNEKLTHLTCNDPYFKSRLGGIWGWATWRRAWNLYEDTPNLSAQSILQQVLSVGVKSSYEIVNGLFLVKHDNLQTWDYQWVSTVIKNKGWYIVPKYSMSKNIGFGEDATHTKDLNSLEQAEPSQILPQIRKKLSKNKLYSILFFLDSKNFHLSLVTRVNLLIKIASIYFASLKLI